MGWAEDIWNSAKQKVSNVTEKIGNAIDDGISFVKDNAHTLLDAAGFIPGVGTAADVIHAGIYVAEGDWKNAGLCALSAVPGIGDGIAAVGKVAKVGKAVKVGKTISKVGKTVNTVVWRGKSTIDALKGDPTGAILDVLFSGKWKFKQKLGNFLGKVGKKISYRLKPLLGRLGGVKDWLKKLLGKVKTGASKAGQKLTQWGKNLASKLKQKLSDLKARLKSFGKKVKDKILEATCFTEDTLVYTKEGYVPIQNIRAGDDIYSREERTGETGFQKVEEVFLRSVHTIYTIEVNTTTKIQTTSKHPFYVEGEGWVIANQLQVGMNLQTINGTAVITDLRKERTEEEVPVYNFRVSEWSSYFVSDWNVYVHNGKGYKRRSEAVAGDMVLNSEPYDYFNKIKNRTDIDPDGYFDIVVHGDINKVQIQINGKTMFVDHRFIGNMLLHSDDYYGQPIRLLSCNTGFSDTGFAQNLANYLNVEVKAPTKFIWAYPSGRHTVAGGKVVNGKLVMVPSDKGIMKSFYPGIEKH